ncbi:MAG TPA: creatininase family protein [Pseudonocardiaceae bacterium]|jgi:creatinine amidohydrolase|nr:creatininase family protein [Pseudonocardiaceae bacterium]
MTAYMWHTCDRMVLGSILPESLVVLPIGAVEQHGPHLPSGTDGMIVDAVTATAVRLAADRAVRDVVVAPTVPFGASDHHFPFGATLSLTNETATSVLVDLLRSIGRSGASRVLIVNGHGGNRGPCHSAAHVASTRLRLHAAYVDYWMLAPADPAEPSVPVPGHAGAFETSLIKHLRPELVGTPPTRPTQPAVADVSDVLIHTETRWRALDGYTDTPADAAARAGGRWFDACAAVLADRIVALAAVL